MLSFRKSKARDVLDVAKHDLAVSHLVIYFGILFFRRIFEYVPR